MKISKNGRRITVGAIVLIVCALSVLAYLELSHRTDIVKKPSTIRNQKEAERLDDQRKKTYLDNAPTSKTDKEGNESLVSNYQPPTESSALSITATQNQSNVTISTRLKGYSDGMCKLTVTKGGQIFTQEAEVLYQAETSTCMGFVVPVSQLGTGSWAIKLTVVSNGVSNEKEIQLEVL